MRVIVGSSAEGHDLVCRRQPIATDAASLQRRTFLIGSVMALCSCSPLASTKIPDIQHSMTDTHSKQVGIAFVLSAARKAGFTTPDQLLSVLAIGIAESSLWSAARTWHPEYGHRPATDIIGVQGPAEVWKDGRQMHSDRGLWQISSYWWPRYTDAECDNFTRAAHIVFAISKGGRDFRLWDPFKAGTAQKHYDVAYDGWPALRPLVGKFLTQGRI